MPGRLAVLRNAPLRRVLGAGLAAAGVIVVTLCAATGPMPAGVAAAGALAFVAAAVALASPTRHVERFGSESITGAGISVFMLVLAWLVPFSRSAVGAIQLLALAGIAYAGLYLSLRWVTGIAALVFFSHGTALFMLSDEGTHPSLSALWTQAAAFALALAWIVAASAAVRRLRLRLGEARAESHDLRIEAGERAGRDALTGALQERALLEALEREIARAERVGKPLSVARVDADGIGPLNAAHGRSTGDIALRRFAAAATGALRDVDVLGRYTGEEFVVLLPDTALEGAVVAANRILRAVRAEPAPEVDGRRHLGCTIGVAEHRAGENTRLVIGRAESALNYAKAAGRGRVVALDADGRPSVVASA